MIDLLLRNTLYRDTAPVLATSFVTGDKLAAPIILVPRNCSNSTKLLPWRQNLRHTFLATVTILYLKYQDSIR